MGASVWVNKEAPIFCLSKGLPHEKDESWHNSLTLSSHKSQSKHQRGQKRIKLRS